MKPSNDWGKRGRAMSSRTSEEAAEAAARADRIRDISVAVYKTRLEQPSGSGPGAVERMLEKDGDGGVKLRGRAAI